uniref:Histidine phosphatase superfamily (Branch 1) n=1 Tax=viral metagenome TaxID=1070528 RepID=A0A6C0IHN4_9ZZZZ
MANPITVNVIFTRHGYSCANAQRNAVGYKTHVFVKDPQLHPIGIQEATALGRLLAERNIPIHAFCCSQLFRTMQTAHYIKTAYERTKDSYHLNEPLFPPIAILPGINELGSITSDNTPHTYDAYQFDMKKLGEFVGSKLVDLSDGSREFITDKNDVNAALSATIESVLNMLKTETIIGDTVNILIASHHAILKKILKKGYAIDMEQTKINNTDAIVMQRFTYKYLPFTTFEKITGTELPAAGITDEAWPSGNTTKNTSLFGTRCIYRAPLKVADELMKRAQLCPPNYAESPATFKNTPLELDTTVVMKMLHNLPTGDIGATLLANELYFSPIVTVVDISECNVTDVGALALSNAAKNRGAGVHFIFKDGNKLTGYGIRLLTGSSRNARGGYTKKTQMHLRKKTLKKQKV